MSGHMMKTSLEQFAIGSVEDSLTEFTKKTQDAIIPLVLTPTPLTTCNCYMSIPTGPHCVMHKWGKDDGYNEDLEDNDFLATPGLICCTIGQQIAYVVTSQAVTYNAPVKSCPTADNVMVDCDLTLIFSIGPGARQVKKFVYLLGARRFDEMLEAAVQEAIRHLIRTCPHTDVYELRGGNSDKVRRTLDELNKKFQPFGVNFSSAAITEVRFSKELQTSLQSTTSYASKCNEEIKRQKNELDKIKFRGNRELTDLERQHARIIQDLQALRTRVEINRTEMKTKADGQARVKITQAKQNAKVSEKKAESEKKVASNNGLAIKEEKVSKVRAVAAAKKIEVKAACDAEIEIAKRKKMAAEAVAAALVTEGELEAKASVMLKKKREHNLRMAKNEALAHLAAKTNIVVSGITGDELLRNMIPSEIMKSRISIE